METQTPPFRLESARLVVSDFSLSRFKATGLMGVSILLSLLSLLGLIILKRT